MTRKQVFLLLAVLWMAVIFFLSARNAEDSTRDSLRAGFLIGRLMVKGFEGWSEEEQTVFVEKIDHPVRKAAHAGEFGILALLWLGTLAGYSREKRKAAALPDTVASWGIATLYAVTDEIHQIFVPGRSAQAADVLIDSAGAFCAIFLFLMFYGVVLRAGSEKRRESRG